MNQHWYIAEIRFLAHDFKASVGDFDLVCIRRVPSGASEEYEIEIKDQTLEIQMAPLHLHQIARSRHIILPSQRLETMLSLEWDSEPEDTLYLAPLTALFPESPVWMVGKELGMVRVIRERQDGMYIAHVSPVTPHIAGLIVGMSLWCATIEQLLPLHQALQRAHLCRQQSKRSAFVMKPGR
jgi:hypothetical protein